jgi:hypothetical protein
LLEDGALPDLLRWTSSMRAALPARLEVHAPLRDRFVALEIWARLFVRGEAPEAVGALLEQRAGAGDG